MNQYLTGADLAAYGVARATTDQIAQASAVVNAVCHKPEGLVYVADSSGNPAYMAGASPQLAWTGSAIAAGSGVQVTLTGPLSGLFPGQALTLDNATANLAETCAVTAVNGNVVTLDTVVNPHAAGFPVVSGLTIVERRTMPNKRPITTLSRTPIMRLASARGRYAYGRRSVQSEIGMGDFNLLASLQSFGGPPLWEVIDVTRTDVARDIGTIWVPAGIMLAYYSDIEVHYLAGWSQANLPSDIKQATANIVNAIQAAPMDGNLRSQAAGGSNLVRFVASYVDNDTQLLLSPYRARVFA